MIRIPLILVLILSPVALAQYGGGADSYALQRWEEDYSHLKDSPRDNLYDALKFVPLNKSGDAYLSFGGQARYRYDYFNNPTFGPGANDENGFHLQRYLLHMDAHFSPHLRAFVQVDSSFVDGRVGGPRYGDVDHLDLQQGFVDLKTSNDANPYAFLRLGRQELTYGAQRYISPDDWRNVRRSFDGARLSVSVPGNTTDFFITRPVIIEQNQFNDADSDTLFSGIYNVTALPDFIPDASSKVEVYLLALNQTEDSIVGVDVDTYTVGARFHTRPGAWDFDLEGNYQFGSFDSADISAWSIATEAGYTFESVPMTPRTSLGLDMASGSSDPSDRFNQLFPPTYNYLGHIYLFGRTNLTDLHAGLDLHLTKRLTLFTSQHIYWRTNDDDALYNLSGAVVRADNGSDAGYVGTEFDIVLNCQFNKNFSGYIGWGHFFTGDFIQQTGASEDVDFLYAAVTFTF